MDNNLRRSIILEHYQHPKNKGLIEDDGYILVNMNNESCIDEVNLMMKVENGIIQDIRFDGEACAICTSSTSIMIDTLLGKTIEQAEEIIQNFEAMINEQSYEAEILEQANVYSDISKQPNRKKCALLGWWGAQKGLEESESRCEDD